MSSDVRLRAEAEPLAEQPDLLRARRVHELVPRLDDGVPPRHHRRPRRYASYGIRFPPAGCTSSGSNAPSSPTRARQTSRSPSRAPMCGDSARTRFTSSCAGASGSSSRSAGRDLLGVRRTLLGLRLEVRLVLREDVAQKLGRDLGRARVDGAGVVVRPDRERALRRDRPGVERLDRPVDRHAGLVSPARIARSTGAAPRQRGSSDGWTLSHSARSSSTFGISRPYAQTTTVSRARARRSRRASPAAPPGSRAARPPPSPAAPRRLRPRPARLVRPRQQLDDLVLRGEPLEHVGPERPGRGDRDPPAPRA